MTWDWTPEYVNQKFMEAFPGASIDIDWRPRYHNGVVVSHWMIVGVRFPPVNGNEKGDYSCRGLTDESITGWGTDFNSLEDFIDYFKKEFEYHKKQPKHIIREKQSKPERLPRPIVQLELEAAEKDNGFETFLRELLEAQLGARRIDTERINRYLGMSREKMYGLLIGIGCSKEKVEQLRKLDL